VHPKTISASALNTADMCLARYQAENILFTPTNADKSAANVGTACHAALENYVRIVYMERAQKPSFDLLGTLYDVAFKKTFDTVEASGPLFDDGFDLLKRWFLRTDLSDVTVVSVEKKTRFPIPTSQGDIPFTYIVDRVDLIQEGDRKILRIVDYKTIRAFLSHDDVREKLQARVYDLMMRIEWKGQGIDEFQVVFDLLRHEQVGVIFSAEEAKEAYYGIIARAERILATPDENPPETLNPECPYCVRKTQCRALRKNIQGGGLFSIPDIDAAVGMRHELDSQSKGLKSAMEELDSYIIEYSKQNDALTFTTDDDHRVTISARKTRDVNNTTAASILGPELMKRYGKIGVGDIDQIIRDELVDAETAEKLRKAIGFKLSAPSIKITKK